MARFVGAIDQGTTSTRFMILDHEAHIVSVSQREHRQIFPKPGWVEHDALEIWKRCREVVNEALSAVDVAVGDIGAIGVTNQRETTVVWNKNTGEPSCNAIVWQDTRTAGICSELAKEGGPNRFRSRTGLPLATYFAGPKLKWILDNIPGARRGAEKGELLFGTIDTWLIWKLTGKHLTDVTNASRTLLMNLATLDWDEDMLQVFGIPREMLPEIRESSGRLGEVRTGGESALEGLPIAGDLGDQQAALVGQACLAPGEAKNTYGTGCFLLLNTGTTPVTSKSGLLTTVAYKFGNGKAAYALEGSIAIAGALVQWLRDNLGLINQSSEIEGLAASVEDSAGIYFVPAFSGLFAPYWRSDARGAIVGMTRFVNKGHLARAILEATAFQTRDVFEAMILDSGVRLTALKVDGGMVGDDLLMQFQADILGVPVVRPRMTETTALGAAYAAGLAVGFWKDEVELRANWQSDKEWQPRIDEARRSELYSGWKKAVTRTFDWAA